MKKAFLFVVLVFVVSCTKDDPYGHAKWKRYIESVHDECQQISVKKLSLEDGKFEGIASITYASEEGCKEMFNTEQLTNWVVLRPCWIEDGENIFAFNCPLDIDHGAYGVPRKLVDKDDE